MSSSTPPPILRDLPDELLGPRVCVRPYRSGDGPALWEAVDESREHLRPWMPWVDKHQTVSDSEEVARRLHAQWILREDLTVGLWERDGTRLLGGSGLHRIHWDVPSFEIGYWIRPTAEGQGYVTEAVRLLCGLAFDTLGAQRVFIRCAAENDRSAAVARRLGFRQEGHLRNEGRRPDGRLYDMLVFALTPEDWARCSDGRS